MRKSVNKICKLTLTAIMAVAMLLATCLCLVNVAPKKAQAASYNERIQEYRAVWVTPIVGNISNYTSQSSYKSQINGILDNMESWGMNTLVFHVRTHNNALYKSSLNPLASWWANVDFDVFDPLAWTIEECHNRGIEFHAWLNPYRVKNSSSGYYTGSRPAANPANNSSNLITVGSSTILDPGIPSNRQFIVDTCMEIVENYDVDAIHFDDYFYIEGADDYSTRQQYNTSNLSIGDFRRQSVNLLIEKLHNELKTFNTQNNRAVELGVAPSNMYKNREGSASSYPSSPTYDSNGTLIGPLYTNAIGLAHYDNYLYADTKKWVDNEWIDYITPQSYHATDHSTAPFANVAQWWDWEVANKKVNLSMGVGIYFAQSSTAGWDSSDELSKQMLIANGKEHVEGLCFYHYGSLLDTGTGYISNYVSTLKSNWTKKIPSVVKPQHTHLDEPTVTGVSLTGNTLSWDKLDNVRGYAVWKVASGTSVDMTNLNHLYDYVQTTSVTVQSGYDYYVSSVNLANEFSEPSSTNPLLQAMDEDAKAFKATLKTHVLKQYKLPTSYNDYSVSWEYVKSSDSSLYDLTSGNVLVEYLATTNVSLKGTITKDGISRSFTHTINVGYTKADETALFYRNTPNAMNSAEDTGANASFIGWCGHAMRFAYGGTNYVFFPALGNCFELTSSEIPSAQWGSCAKLYYNASSSAISATCSQFGVNASASYGYFIIGSNGTVRTTAESPSATDTITLNVGEYLFCPQYLDSQITGSVMKPASNLAVGTSVEVVTAEWVDKASESELNGCRTEAISTLDNYVADMSVYSVTNQAKIQLLISECKTAINSATSTTDIDNLLTTCLAEIDEFKTLFAETKESALAEIGGYLLSEYLSDYSSANQSIIVNKVNSAKINVNSATTSTQIDTIMSTLRNEIAEVPTIENEQSSLSSTKTQYINSLESAYDLNLYSQTDRVEMQSIIDDYKQRINSATTSAQIVELYELARIDLDAFNVLDLQDLKDSVLAELDEYLSTNYLNNYSTSNKNLITTKVNNAKDSINSATSEGQIATVKTNLFNELQNIPTLEDEESQLSYKKTYYIGLLQSNYNLDLYSNADKIEMQEIIDTYIQWINSASSISMVEALYDDATFDLNQFVPDGLQVSKNEALEDAKEYADLVGIHENNSELKNLLKDLETDLKDAQTNDEIDILVEDFMASCDYLVETGNTGNSGASWATYGIPLIVVFVAGAALATFILIKKRKKTK